MMLSEANKKFKLRRRREIMCIIGSILQRSGMISSDQTTQCHILYMLS